MHRTAREIINSTNRELKTYISVPVAENNNNSAVLELLQRWQLRDYIAELEQLVGELNESE